MNRYERRMLVGGIVAASLAAATIYIFNSCNLRIIRPTNFERQNPRLEDLGVEATRNLQTLEPEYTNTLFNIEFKL